MSTKYLFLLVAISVLVSSCARPVADFTWSGQDNPAPSEIRFENKSKHATEYYWEFGDGATATDPHPIHTYSLSGNYTIALVALNKSKKTRMEKTIQITAPEPCLVEVNTPYGKMIIQLSDETPLHRDNFMKLVEEHFYDSLLFHRVIRGFMIQGGDPSSKGASPQARLGSGGPGYQVDAEFRTSLAHTKGALCAARMGDGANPQKKSSGSQFYIVQGNKATDAILDGIEARKGFRYTAEQRDQYKKVGGTPQLDQDYTVFGMVIEGLDVIDQIANAKTLPGDRPEEDIWMTMRLIK